MAQSQREKDLLHRIKELECEVEALKSIGPKRCTIQEMSAEVVDSNPYRYCSFAASNYLTFTAYFT